MAADSSVVAAMEAAVGASPENAALRLHLAGLLLESGRAEGALEQCVFVLAREPAHVEALGIAARAARESGDGARADGYERLFAALGGQAQTAPPKLEPPAEPNPRRFAVSSGGDYDLRELFTGEENGDEDDEDGLVRRRAGGERGAPLDDLYDNSAPKITLRDVAGMEAVKQRLHVAFLGPLQNPEMRALYGKSLRGGLLLYGPPGCGKTFIARATAGELGAHFISVGLSDVLDMYLGQSERNLKSIFEAARRNRPCVLFFDEIDALGRKRSLQRESAGRDVVNQLLSELDSVGSDNEGLFVLAATNHPWDVDSALRRPGRLDRTLLVLPPDGAAREAAVRLHMKDRPVEGVDFARIAARTEEWSGADLMHLCEGAVERAMEDSIKSGRVRKIGQKDFDQALREIKPSIRPWLDTARNYALFANEGGVYDELLEYLRQRKLL